MKRIMLWMCSTASALVLLFSYHTSTQGSGGGAPRSVAAAAGIVSTTPAITDRTTTIPSTPSTAGSTAVPRPSSTPTTSGTVMVNGAAVSTRYGNVQVQITVTAGKITKADAIDYPRGGRDSEINDVAVPLLDAEVIATQKAQIDTVSGATYTSEGYRTSLQSALNAAHL